MSIQIAIVQSEKDEKDLIEFLLQREALLAAPRLFRSDAFEPKVLGNEDAAEQIVFRKADMDLVHQFIKPIPDREVSGWKSPYSGLGLSLVASYLGLSIEWLRTSRVGPSGYCAGRFYFDYETPKSHDSTVALNRLFTAVVRYVKKTSPKKSDERYPSYVGADLVRMVDSGEATVIYPNGKIVQLVKNKL